MSSYLAAVTLGLAATSAFVSAAPTKPSYNNNQPLTLKNGFPTPNQQQLEKIQNAAFGIVPNAPAPDTLSDDTFNSIRLIALNENVESVFFNDLINNITLNRDGKFNPPNRTFTLASLNAFFNQEIEHSVNANGALQHFGKDQIGLCKYRYPVSDFNGAIQFIVTVTNFVQGVLGDVIVNAAATGDAAFTRGVAGALSNEGEQDGWMNSILGLRPTSKAFNTASAREYAFSLLQDVIVPGSCPSAVGEIDFPVFQPLTAPNPSTTTKELEFTFNPLKMTRTIPNDQTSRQQALKDSYGQNFVDKYSKNENWRQLRIAYLNGQDAIVDKPITSFSIDHDGNVKAVAAFPFDDFKMFGLTVAALTTRGDFTTVNDMVNATLFAPALLETQEPKFGV